MRASLGRPTDRGEREHLDEDDVALFLAGTLALQLDSTMAESATYYPDTDELRIVYPPPGRPWRYRVGRDKAEDFARAPSKGTWLWDHVLIRGKGNQGKHQVPARPD